MNPAPSGQIPQSPLTSQTQHTGPPFCRGSTVDLSHMKESLSHCSLLINLFKSDQGPKHVCCSTEGFNTVSSGKFLITDEIKGDMKSPRSNPDIWPLLLATCQVLLNSSGDLWGEDAKSLIGLQTKQFLAVPICL